MSHLLESVRVAAVGRSVRDVATTADAVFVRPVSTAAAAVAHPPAPIRVAHLIHTMAHGGVETALINWTRTFNRQRVEPHLLCFANPDRSEQAFVSAVDRAGLSVQLVPWGRRKPVWSAARVVARHVRQLGIDILHCHNTYADAVGLVASWMTRVKTVTTVYVWSGVGIKRRALQGIDAHLLRRFDQVTAHCEAARRDTVARGFRAQDVPVLPCGFEERSVHLTAAERWQRRAAMGVDAGEAVLIKVARFWPEKRHDVLLEGFRRLLARGRRVRLWIPGVGPEEHAIKRLAHELGLTGRVTFLGFRNDLAELLALADIQVHTSDEEGVPLALLSGMAAGLPIVATRVGGVAEVIADGVSGVLIPRRDPERLAEAVAALLDDPCRGQALGQEARRFVRQDYSLEAAAARVEALYAEVATR